MFIPKKIKVGFQSRKDTFTKQLAYVIYYDNKGVLRKSASWENWRNKEIDPQEFENNPAEGFVLNKKVGGYKSDWNFRNAYVRVYDPRGFEFEISVENLLFILSCGGCSPGKGLEGKFVYAWNNTELVLLPVNSDSYSESVRISNLSGRKVGIKELSPGTQYFLKNGILGTYVGRYRINIIAWNMLDDANTYSFFGELPKDKKIIFCINGKYSVIDKNHICQAATVDENFKDILHNFESVHDLKVTKISTRTSKDGIKIAKIGDSICLHKYGQLRSDISLNNGLVEIQEIECQTSYFYSYMPISGSDSGHRTTYHYPNDKYKNATLIDSQELVFELSNGEIYVPKI